VKKKYELFDEKKINHNYSVSSGCCRLFQQERDWTCAVACIRSIMSGLVTIIPSEDNVVDLYNLVPGPLYSKDIKKLGILKDFDVKYGCDNINVSFDMILSYLENGYHIMVESMYNYAHWMVLLGYYPLRGGIEKSELLLYDPYYDRVRLVIVDEFLSMWIDGNHTENMIEKDFVAIKSK